MKPIYWAGIGSRTTPPNIGDSMKEIARSLSQNPRFKFICRSGGAAGADTYFDAGCEPGRIEVFRPKDATPESIVLASKHHPAWHNCNDYARNLHGRNSQIILGRNLDTPVHFVVCYTLDGSDSGGTGLGMRLAKSNGIPVYNLRIKADYDKVFKCLNTPEFLWG